MKNYRNRQNLQDYLHSRRFDASKHSVWYDDEELVVTFPLWNLSGQLVGYQQHRPFVLDKKLDNVKEGRYFTHLKEARIGLWGLESWGDNETLFLTEGVFDACKLTWFGASALAVLQNDPSKSTKRWFWMVRKFRKIIAVCDGDMAGKRLAEVAHNSIQLPDGKDLGDMDDDYVRNLILANNK